jgi:hypothetical protein
LTVHEPSCNIKSTATDVHKITLRRNLKVNQVFGEINLFVSVPVDSESEEMGLLEANYNFNKERLIAFELVAIDCRGVKHKIAVHDCDKMKLEEFVG